MMNQTFTKTEIGVIIGRFQIHELHKAHKDLINTVSSRHKRTLILLGQSPTLVTRNNPLDYPTRKLMIQKEYPNIHIEYMPDMASDEEWSKGVDKGIRSVFPMGSVCIYGSRDSFIPHYHGQFETVELESSHTISANEVRKIVSEEIRSSPDFRRGVIYAAYNKFPTVYQCVDAAIIKTVDKYPERRGNWGGTGPEPYQMLLLARKRTDKANKWRFIGGFVDPRDESKEYSVKREVYEETGGNLAVYEPIYIGSVKVEDWRYRKEVDSIMTCLFKLEYMYGYEKASDDIDELEWFDIDKLTKDNLVQEHGVLLDMLKSHLKKEI